MLLPDTFQAELVSAFNPWPNSAPAAASNDPVAGEYAENRMLSCLEI